MIDSKPEFFPLFGSGPGESRAIALRALEERNHARRLELESQSSATHDAKERIRIWERIHGLRLPTAAAHPLVAVIAQHTQLEIRDVREEQQRRRMPSPPVVRA